MTSCSKAGFYKLLIDAAKEQGFPLADALDVEPLLDGSSTHYKEHVQKYDEWISAGFAGSMQYLIRGRDRRADPRLLFSETKSALCVAMPYPRSLAGQATAVIGPRYARYLQGNDYHLNIYERLERAMFNVANAWRTQTHSELSWKTCVDTSAVLERTLAALAGLGWIGKNTMLIHPRFGSYIFLGVVFINQETGMGPKPLKNYCGHCNRCLEDCPTNALQKPGTQNAPRCISYLTLEERGDLSHLEDQQRRAIGPWIAGCDICQEVCPFNFKSARTESNSGFITDLGATSKNRWEELLKESEEEYRARVRQSSLSRVKPAQFRRNLAIALTNTLQNENADECNELILKLKPLVIEKCKQEPDATAKLEWQNCLEAMKQPLRVLP